MNLQNIALGVLRTLEILGEKEAEIIKLKSDSENYQKWWRDAEKRLSEQTNSEVIKNLK